LRQAVTNSDTPFSIYVPGLAGISQVEEYRTESIVRRGVASGDANLFLRNVIYLIEQKDRLDELTNLMKVIFPDFYIDVSFDQESDVYIDVSVSLTGRGGKLIPLELIGTGVQQALQIFSYVTLFHPVLLLLDEPDSHLHPDNQGLLVNALLEIAANTNTNIIVSTHSRHIVDALYEESNVVWLKEGRVYEQGDSIGRIPLLMDIGALDSFERLREGTVAWVILTEDASFEFIASIANGSGYNSNELVIYSYKTSSNIQSAILLADFINEIAPNTNVIIHRDRDFMEGNEVGWVSEQIEESGAIPFITEGSDIETYFISKEHLSALLNEDEEDIDGWLAEIATEHHNVLMHKFTRKRDDLKFLYRKREEDPPETLNLIGNDSPMPANKRQGKFMIRKVRAGMHEKYGKTVDLLGITAALSSPRLIEIREGVDA
jgi:energy-coupling factor transporter ATP-binding protein EcfA2